MFGGHNNPTLFDLLGGIYGNMEGWASRQQGPRASGDQVLSFNVTLEDLYKGTTKEYELTKNVNCVDCNRRSDKDGDSHLCENCNGNGRIGSMFIQQKIMKCEKCNGLGRIFDNQNECRKCFGRRTVEQLKTLQFDITPGMHDGQKFVFYSEASQKPGIEKAGDVFLVLKAQPHELFQRSEDDLIIKRKISLNEALCGFSMTLTHLDGRTISLSSPPGQVIKPGSFYQVANEGMPIENSKKRGHLYVALEIDFSSNTSLAKDDYKVLEGLLQPRQQERLPVTGASVEEVSLRPFNSHRHGYSEDPFKKSKRKKRRDVQEESQVPAYYLFIFLCLMYLFDLCVALL